FLLLSQPPPCSILFPYTTLFRSVDRRVASPPALRTLDPARHLPLRLQLRVRSCLDQVPLDHPYRVSVNPEPGTRISRVGAALLTRDVVLELLDHELLLRDDGLDDVSDRDHA